MEAARIRDAAELLPAEILSLPKVEVPVAGVTGYCLNDDNKQIVFFIMEEGVSFPDHSHCDQQGTVVSGEMIIEIDGVSNLFQPGDLYHVPEGVAHRTLFSKRTILVDFSDAPDRYKVSA